MNYLCARSLDDALAALARGPHRIVCGATDAYAQGQAAPSAVPWLDISGVDALQGITASGSMLRIGAAVTWDRIDRCEQMPGVLREAARTVGSRQIRLRGSLGGNLCHASPVADGIPALLALDARVELAGPRGVRQLPLPEFVLGRQRTALLPDELLAAILVESPGPSERTAFIKLAQRDASAIAVVAAAVRLRWRDDRMLASAAIAVGGASEAAIRLCGLESLLEGAPREAIPPLIAATPMPELSPIDDRRGSAALRHRWARVAVQRACARCEVPA
jgi:CO/xanthine dehydrogenase FAD-binding subunit